MTFRFKHPYQIHRRVGNSDEMNDRTLLGPLKFFGKHSLAIRNQNSTSAASIQGLGRRLVQVSNAAAFKFGSLPAFGLCIAGIKVFANGECPLMVVINDNGKVVSTSREVLGDVSTVHAIA